MPVRRRAPLACALLALRAVPALAAEPPTESPPPAPTPAQLEPGVQTSPAAVAAPAVTPAVTAPPAAAPAQPGAARAAGKDGARKGVDRLQLDTSDIKGNRELPKVMYVVPWKRSDLGDLVGRPVNSLLDEVLQPLDRDVFRRENRYYDALQPGANTAKPDAAQGSAPKP
ncbi:MAG: hypothetical protein JO341_13790 [Gammaproteobacteria bacterium]|nr:hypothetical protein [Gammaproteobacteria bacterium]MBV9622076.1 hypothetical protein [Gammaproteobacteria bacterium]